MHWYKRDPDAALAGMAELTFEERGAYNSILDLLYSRDGDVPDDDVRVARMIACHWRTWAALKARLIELGKLRIEDGKITARRVQETLKEASELSEKQRKKAAQRWQKEKSPNENNATSDATGNASTSTATPKVEEQDSGAAAPTAKRVKRVKRERKYQSALPDAFEPNYEAATRVNLSRREGEREFVKFKNHALQTGRTCVNWQAAWANWCINAAQYLKRPPPGGVPGAAMTITPASPSWNAWKAYFRDNNENVRAAIMDKCADEGRAFTVKTEWPPGHEMNDAA